MYFELSGLYMFLQIRSTSLFAPHPSYPLLGHVSLVSGFGPC